MCAFLSGSELSTSRSMPLMLSFVAFYFEDIMQGETALIWKERRAI